jgi:hypothetical protein
MPICFIREHYSCAYQAWKPFIHCALLMRIRRDLLSSLLVAILVQPGSMPADPIAVRYPEGSAHGFLVVRTLEGKIVAAGDLIQTVHGDRVVSQLVFRFQDGSIDDESAIFSQRGAFRLISDHHVQKGPIFPKPTDVFINASTGQVTVRYPGHSSI